MPDWQKLLVFEVKDKNMDPEAVAKYREMFDKAKQEIEESPNHDYFEAWMGLALAKKSVGDYEGAKDTWLYASNLSPGNSRPIGNLADLYTNFLNDPEKAEHYYKKALSLDPNEISYILGLAEVYRYKMPGKEALFEQTILDALKRLPDEVNLISNLAMYYRQTNQVDKAIEWYEKLVQLAPDNQMAREDLEELKRKKQ